MSSNKLALYAKIFLKVFVIFIFASATFTLLEDYQYEMEYKTYEDDIDYFRWCQSFYEEERYNDLREDLLIFDLYDEKYDKYWEIVEIYETHQEIKQYYKAISNGYDDKNNDLEKLETKLKDLKDNIVFEENIDKAAKLK